MPRSSTFFEYTLIDDPIDTVAAIACDGLDEESTASFVFLNPHSIVLAETDAELKSSLLESSGRFCDGVGLWWACLLLNRKRVRRICGYEFFQHFSAELSKRGRGHVFFLGGNEESLKSITAKYATEYPGVRRISSYSPPYKPIFSNEDIASMANQIIDSGADTVWVGLGSPKQEKVLRQLLNHTNVRVIAAIGAVFDFYAGTVSQAPTTIRSLGLEWIYRLVQEPRRLWKRTVISAPLFVGLIAKRLIIRRT